MFLDLKLLIKFFTLDSDDTIQKDATARSQKFSILSIKKEARGVTEIFDYKGM
jgi:hypothetical protein